MKISFRLNEEYDQELINKLKSYKQQNLSKVLRKILRDNLDYYKEESKKKEIIKWNFPNKEV